MPDPAPAPTPAPTPEQKPATAPVVDLTKESIGQIDPTSAFKAGAIALPEGGRVPVRLADGSVGTVDATEAASVVDAGGSLLDGSEWKKLESASKYGDAAGMAAAGGFGLLRGATVGISDPLIVGVARLFGGEEAAERTREYMQGVREENPVTSIASEIGGVVIPALATGGAAAGVEGAAEGGGALARAGSVAREGASVLGAAPRAVTAVGHAAETGVARLVGESASSLAGRMLQKAAAKGAGAAAEGALFGIGNEISEDTLGDHQITGQKLLAAAGHGALFGLGVGAAIGAGGELSRAVLGKIAPAARKASEEQAIRSISARKTYTAELEAMPGGKAAAGRQLLDDVGIKPGMSVQEIAPLISESLEKKGEEIGDILQRADAAGYQGPKFKNILDRVNKDVIEGQLSDLRELNAGTIKKIDDILVGFGRKAGIGEGATLENATMSFRDAQQMRAALDAHIDWKSDKVAANAIRQVRRIIEDEIVSAGETAAKEAGDVPFAEAYKAAKLDYARLKVMNKAAADTITRFGANASHSLTDKMVGAATLGAGVSHALNSVAPGLGTAAAFAGNYGAQQISKIIRTRGASTAAVMLDKMSTYAGIETAIASVDRNVDRAIAGFLEPGTRAEPRVKEPAFKDKGAVASLTDDRSRYSQRVKAIADAVARADEHADRISKSVSRIAPHAPNIAGAFESASLRATKYLAEQIPKGHVDPRSMFSHLDKPRVTDAEAAAFNRKFDAIHDPVTVLDHLRKGTLTRDEVDAVKAVYPDMFREMQQRVMDQIGKAKAKPDYSKIVQLGLLLDIPTDATLRPEFVDAAQKTFAPQQNTKQGGAPTMPSAPKRPLTDVAKAAALSSEPSVTRH